MTYNYNLENFLIKPINGDKRLIIYDKNGTFVDSIITDLSHFFVKNNCLVIKITNKNDIILSFESRTVAQQALAKLELYRKELMTLTGEMTKNERPTINTLNRNMMCLDCSFDGDPWTTPELVTTTQIIQKPRSRVQVIINGSSHIECGKPTTPLSGNIYGCYFTSVADAGDPDKARVNDGDVELGDQLYWVGYTANFALENGSDYVDLEFLI